MDIPSEIEARAIEWLIRLDAGSLSPQEQALFDAWLDSCARHHVVFLRTQAAWRRADQLKRLRPLDSSIDENLLETATRAWSRLRPSPWFITIAAACLTVVVMGAWFALQLRAGQVYDTAVGSMERIVLHDGSTLNLNTDTQVRVHFTPGRRRVVLSRGEALFEVAHDPDRPFEVRVDDTTVRAVGTAFSVRRREQQTIEVFVAAGRVAIVPDTAARAAAVPTLVAGDAATMNPDGVRIRKVSQDEIPRMLAWRSGRLWFERQRLADAVAEFNRYNLRRLAVADPAIADLRIGGAFDATDPEGFVEALERSFGIQAVPHRQAGELDEINLFRANVQQ
jgi:transmembrane sensor